MRRQDRRSTPATTDHSPCIYGQFDQPADQVQAEEMMTAPATGPSAFMLQENWPTALAAARSR